MRKVTPLKIRFVYQNEPDTEDRFWRACNRIFSGLREEILRKKRLQEEGSGELNMRRYIIYAYAPKDLQEREELVESKVTTLKQIAQKENMQVVKTMKDLEGKKEVFKEMWSDIYEGSVTGILCDSVEDLAIDCCSLQPLLWRFLFEAGIEIRTPSYLFRKDLPNNRCFVEIAQEGAMW